MGNSNEKQGHGGVKPYGDGSSFTGEEVKQIEHMFNQLSNQTPESKGQKVLLKESLIQQFPENPEFASNLYQWFQKMSTSGLLTFKDFIADLEVILKEPIQYQVSYFNSRSFEKYGIFLQVSTGNYTVDKDSATVTYDQGLTFLKEVLNCFHSKSQPNPRNIEQAATLIALSFFKDTNTTISWRDMTYNIKNNLPYINKMIKIYFSGKFIEPAIPLRLPVLEEESHILNKELLGVFYLSNSFFHNLPKLQLLYSTAKSGTSFNRLAYSLRGYEAPTLILVKHVEAADELRGKERKSHVFGGFARAGWNDELKYNGDSENYIFSLIPHFKSFYAYRGQGGTNYTYMNTKRIQGSKYKVGLGFGGDSYKNYRLWLDEELESGSYVSPDDLTYEKGFLIDPSITKFNIEHVEIWGLGDQNTLRGQQEWRQREMELIESQRKVDKKAFLQSGFDKEIFFGNTFKTSERADQTDFREEME